MGLRLKFNLVLLLERPHPGQVCAMIEVRIAGNPFSGVAAPQEIIVGQVKRVSLNGRDEHLQECNAANGNCHLWPKANRY